MNLANLEKYHQAIIRLKSWRGDYLYRPDSAQGVVAADDGDLEWMVEYIDGGKVRFKSRKGDYLHRPATAQGVTTWHTGIGNEWRLETLKDGKVKLKNWKGDYLHRPAGNDTVVTTWPVGIGNHWSMEVVNAEPEVVISDIFYDGVVARTEADEYVEIENRGIAPANISGWKITSDGQPGGYVFPDNTVLAVGEVIRVYTNESHPEYGGYSYGSKRSLWNNKGDVGHLFDRHGKEVSTFAYGQHKSERTIADVLREMRVPGCQVVADARAAQEALGGKVDFLTALERALRSLIEDPADGDRYTAATAVKENWDNVPENADAAVLQQMIRAHIDGQSLHLLTEETLGDASASIADTWVFQLRYGMGDLHYVYVDRNGAKDTEQEIS